MMLFWYATAMAAPIQQLMLLNTKGDIMKKKKKLIKVVVILLVTAIVAGTVFIWKSHKAKEASAPSCLLQVPWKQRIHTVLLPW